MSLYSTLFFVVCSVPLIFGQRDANEWPSKKVYEKTPRPTKWTPTNYGKEREWMKNWDKPNARRPTKPKKTPKWKSKYGKSDDYSSKGCGNTNPSFDDTTEKFLEHNGIRRSYIVHLPPSYNHGSDDGHPIILNLHGYSGNAWERMEGSLMNEHADANDYIAVYPQGTSLGMSDFVFEGRQLEMTSWNELAFTAGPSSDGPTCTGMASTTNSELLDLVPSECRDINGCNAMNCMADDVGFIEALLDELEATYCIDRSRVYATGYSNGGMMTQRLGCELNHRLAAIAPQHGQLALGYNCEPKYDEAIPIISIWGTNDEVVPGVAILSEYGSYFTPISHVMYKYGKHNGCNVDEQLPESIASASDGILEWQCVGYNGHDHENGVRVMSCSWNGTHVYPISGGENFALNVIWDFFQNHLKTPRPTKAPKTPQPTRADKSWPSKKSDMRAYADEPLFSNHINYKSCPSEVDFDMNAPCDYEGECEFGEETCCGQTFPSLVCQCGGERSFCYYTDACFHPNC